MIPEDGDPTIRPGFSALVAENDKEQDTAVCYTGGFAVKEVHQMCDVTSKLCMARTCICTPLNKETIRSQDPRYVARSSTSSYLLLQPSG